MLGGKALQTPCIQGKIIGRLVFVFKFLTQIFFRCECCPKKIRKGSREGGGIIHITLEVNSRNLGEEIRMQN